MQPTDVWVIIVGYRNAEEVATCLRAVSRQSFTKWGIVVCENGGDDAFARLAASVRPGRPVSHPTPPLHIKTMHTYQAPGQHPLYLLQAEENLGYAGAINAAIASIACHKAWKHIWILNPDTDPDEQTLTCLLIKANSDNYGIVGSRLIYDDTRLVQAYGGTWNSYTAHGISIGRGNQRDEHVDVEKIEAAMDYVLGACMLVTRNFIDCVGLMNEDYFLYCEEVDWCLRRQDFKLGYAHDSIVYHTQGTTIGSKGLLERSRLAVYLDERNRLLIARRFYQKRFIVIAVCAALRCSRYIKNAAWQNFFAACQGWWAGIRGETGRPTDGRFG